MDYRNAKRTATTEIDCEINHPVYGWIPFTANQEDTGASFDVAALWSKMNLSVATQGYTQPSLEEVLAAERATMACTPMQGILALGEVNWGTILAYRDTASWQEKVIIDSAQTWVRNSQNIAFFQYLLGFTDTQVDDLFRTAMLIDA